MSILSSTDDILTVGRNAKLDVVGSDFELWILKFMYQFSLTHVPYLQRGVLRNRRNIQLIIRYPSATNWMRVRVIEREKVLPCSRTPHLNAILVTCDKVGL